MSKSLPIALNVSAGSDLAAYINVVNAAKSLSLEEEKHLAKRFIEQGDLEAARELVMSNLRHVVRVARGFMGYGLPLADLIQEGNVGLMKAVKRYDPLKEVRLVSFAVHWIKAEIYDYVLKNWRIVKVATTKSQRKLFFNLRKSKAKLGWLKNEEVHQLAKNLDVSPKTVQEMESRMQNNDLSFEYEKTDDDGRSVPPAFYLANNVKDPETLALERDESKQMKLNLSKALAELDDRARDIISKRWLAEEEKATLHELADIYDISAERVRQIEKRAMDKLKGLLSPN